MAILIMRSPVIGTGYSAPPRLTSPLLNGHAKQGAGGVLQRSVSRRDRRTDKRQYPRPDASAGPAVSPAAILDCLARPGSRANRAGGPHEEDGIADRFRLRSVARPGAVAAVAVRTAMDSNVGGEGGPVLGAELSPELLHERHVGQVDVRQTHLAYVPPASGEKEANDNRNPW